MIKLVAFDWNGTLLADTRPSIIADELVLRDLGIKRKITLREFQATFSIPIRDYWINLGLAENLFDKNAEFINRLFLKYYKPIEKLAKFRSGAKRTLLWLNEHSTSSIIYSNHVVPHIEQKIKQLKADKLINHVLGRPLGDMIQMHSKNKEQRLVNYVKEKRFRPHEVISIGDTEEEIEIGKNHGFWTAGLTGGYNSAQRLKNRKPDFLIRSLPELIKVIKQINYAK